MSVHRGSFWYWLDCCFCFSRNRVDAPHICLWIWCFECGVWSISLPLLFLLFFKSEGHKNHQCIIKSLMKTNYRTWLNLDMFLQKHISSSPSMWKETIFCWSKNFTIDLGLLFLGPKSQEIPLAPEHVSLTWRSRLRRTNSNQVRAVLGSNGCIGSHDGGECFGAWCMGKW